MSEKSYYIPADSDFRFEIVEHRIHPEKRYTQYNLKVTVFPPGLLQPTFQLILWKRFSEVRNLHKQLFKLCEQLYLKIRPPALPDSPLFSRFEPEVIAQRKQTTINLLEFATKTPVLAGSSCFVDFLKGGQQVTFEENVPLQLPTFAGDLNKCRPENSGHFGQSSTSNSYLTDLMTLKLEQVHPPQNDGVVQVKDDNNVSVQPSNDAIADAVASGEHRSVDFLTDAATLISQAQSAEANGDYDVAFESYKCVIGILIEGIKSEPNNQHKIAIKHKIHQYLKRAEDIHRQHLASKGDSKNYSLESPYRKVFASEIKLSNSQQLAKFKVIGICNHVQIVFDIINNQKLALKLVHKFPEFSAASQYVFPKDIPYLMQPIQIQCNSSTFYLFFKYANVFVLSDAMRLASGKSKTENDAHLNKQLQLLKQTHLNRMKMNHFSKSSGHLDSATSSQGGDLHYNEISGLISKARRLLLDVEQTMRLSRVEQERREERNMRLHNQQLLCKLLQSTCPDALVPSACGQEMKTLFTESLIRCWLKQVVQCLQHLHRLNIIYCRLCPQKILLTDDLQQVRLAYVWSLDRKQMTRPLSPFSLILASGSERSNAKCMPYLAPEILSNHIEPGPAADWWSLGLVAYELFTNRHPSTYLCNTYDLGVKLEFPDNVSSEARDLIRQLIKVDPETRLGWQNADEIAQHPFFECSV